MSTTSVLNELLDDAARLVHEVKGMRDHFDLFDDEALAAKLEAFYRRVGDNRSVLGEARVLRIRRLGVPTVRGIDKEKADTPSIPDAILWAETVCRNIESELRRIDSSRILLLTFFAVLASALAAIGTILTLFK